jgi:ABC-type ATPase with predicted acetyltransferase domain
MMPYYSVLNIAPKGHRKQLSVSDGKGAPVFLTVPRFAPAGKGDQIFIDPDHPSNIFSVSTESNEDLIRVSPHYEELGKSSIGALAFDYRLTEVNRPEDLESLGSLEQFHYKSMSMDDDQEDLFSTTRAKSTNSGGRKAVILLYLRLMGRWSAAGYIELQMPLLMCKPRHDLFANPFHHSTRPVSWSVWDQHSMRKFVNTIVRVARVVVHPDYRGLGLARILLSSAKTYCKSRWQISGKRPIFMEISAEMLNYVDFVSSSGFMYVDHTEGNAKRIVTDLLHMQKGYDISFGMMSLQKKYLTTIETYCKAAQITLADALKRLAEVLTMPEPAEVLSATEWAAFRKVLRQRIPYYLCPLDADAENYLRPLLKGRRPPRSKAAFRVPLASLNLRSVAVKSSFAVPQTKNVRIIMDAFGLSAAKVETQIVPPTTVKASGGNIVFIVGLSGSGKSALLAALDPQRSGEHGSLDIRIDGAQDYSAGWLKALPSDIPIFDYFAGRYSPERAFSALSQVGLSEAFALIKPYGFLSRGQQYRAMLADLLLREEQVWLLDEFCADLDPISARVVAHNFRRHVMSSGRIAFVAAANHSHFLDALRPTQVIRMATGAAAQILTYKDYRDEFCNEAV